MIHQTHIVAVMIIHLGILVTWGLYERPKARTGADYLRAGRILQGWAAGESFWVRIDSMFTYLLVLSLFWRRFHGKAATPTIFAGMLFTLAWISTGMEEMLRARAMVFVVAGTVAVGENLFLFTPLQTPRTPHQEEDRPQP